MKDLWFRWWRLREGEPAAVDWQGQIVDEVRPGTYRVQLYNDAREPTVQKLVNLEDMSWFDFYPSREMFEAARP